MHKIAEKGWSEKIFKAYDIRGKYPEEINEDAAYKIARALARYLALGKENKHGLKIVVSRDKRESSPVLEEAFVDGLTDENAEIIDAGVTTTPMHYFVVNFAGADGGAMITASHNPSEFNGFKLSKRGAQPIGEGAGMEEIKNDAIRGIFASAPNVTLPNPSLEEERENNINPPVKKDYLDDYIQFLISHFPNLKSEIIKLTSGRKIPGIEFDTDGDRAIFTDEKGNKIAGDIITALLVRWLVQNLPKAQSLQDLAQRDGASRAILQQENMRVFTNSGAEANVYDLRSSKVVREEIEKYGMRPIESRVGHAFIKPLMRKENAIFGGELSGHYYFRDFFFCDSGIFAALAVLDLMRIEKKSLKELVKPLMRYAKSDELNYEVKDKEKMLDKIAAHFSDLPAGRQVPKISYLDGIKVEYWDESVPTTERWWFNLRPSNTEDFLRLNIEADTPQLLEEKKKLLEGLL